MKNCTLLLAAMLISLFISGCQTGGEQNSSSQSDTTAVEYGETLPVGQPANPALERHLAALEEEWSTVPNPVQATYRGAEFGDYFHLSFETADGKWLDFGDGDNTIGGIELYNQDFESNPALEGKQFKITWEWKESSFNCCEGTMDAVKAKTPSITSIQPVE